MAFILLFVCCILMHYYFKSFVVKSLFYITKQVINALTSPYHVMDCFTLQPKFQSFFGPGVTAEIGKSLKTMEGPLDFFPKVCARERL